MHCRPSPGRARRYYAGTAGICLWLITTGAMAQQQDSLTVEQAVTMAVKRHPSVAQAKGALEAAKAHTQSAWSAYYPSIGAGASAVNVGPDDVFTIPHLGSFKLFPQNNYDAHVGAEYTLLDFGRREAVVESGMAASLVTADALQKVIQELSYRVVQLFYAIVLETKSIEVADEGLASLDRHLSIVKKRLETGSATDYDALKTEVQRAGAQSTRIDIADDLAKKLAALLEVLGMPRQSTLDLRGAFDSTPVHLNTDSLIEAALKNRSDYQLAYHAKVSAFFQHENIKAENLPTLGLRASAGYKNGLFPDIEKLRFNWSAGAHFAVPIFDGLRHHYRDIEAACNESAAESALADIGERIATEVLQAATGVGSAFAKLDVSATQVRFAEESLKLARLKYGAGAITNHDVLDAENDFAQAKLGHLQNQYRYVMSRYALDQATGKKIYSGR
jgi:outer membrane protein